VPDRDEHDGHRARHERVPLERAGLLADLAVDHPEDGQETERGDDQGEIGEHGAPEGAAAQAAGGARIMGLGTASVNRARRRPAPGERRFVG
jgi:hypothetical protein